MINYVYSAGAGLASRDAVLRKGCESTGRFRRCFMG